MTNGGGRRRSNTAREGNRRRVGRDQVSCDAPGRRVPVSDAAGRRSGAAGMAEIRAIPLLPSLASVRVKLGLWVARVWGNDYRRLAH